MNYNEHEYVTPKEYVKVGSLVTRDAIYRLTKACDSLENLSSVYSKVGSRLFLHEERFTRLLEFLKANDLINHKKGIELDAAMYFLERYTPVTATSKVQFVPTTAPKSGYIDQIMRTLYDDKWPTKLESPAINHTRIVDISLGSKFYLMRFNEDRVTVHEINKVAFNSMFKGGEERVLRCITGNWVKPKEIGVGTTTKNYLWTLCRDGMIFYNVKEEIVEELLNKCGESVGCL